MAGQDQKVLSLSADRPGETPDTDLFGYAPFAKQLAASICTLENGDGLVIALHAPWGAGKTTLLNYVKYYIEQAPANDRPVIVQFNPWWFSGQDNLARAFLGQLQAILPDKLKGMTELGKLIGDFSEGIGGVAEIFGVKGIASIGRFFKPHQKDVPALKRKISDALVKTGRRILVVVDDIDRLTAEDIRQLFKVIKALADFPYVTYLLAFDKDIAIAALTDDNGIDGQAYLEKIVQVPFELPIVDKTSLRNALFQKLDVVLEGTPKERFDATYWGNVYFEGIDQFIRVPRDIVRFINTLSVTYPAVRGEVNSVDFIAIEALRVFVPDVYNAIRSDPDKFTGHSEGSYTGQHAQQQLRTFHDAWLESTPADVRSGIKEIMIRLFPKLAWAWSNTGHGADWETTWRNALRVCSADIFPVYFRLAVPQGFISNRDVQTTIQAAASADELVEELRAAAKITRPDGTSKLRALLERLMDSVESQIPEERIPTVVSVLLDIGDELLLPQDENRGMFDLGNELRIARLIYHLLKRKDEAARAAILSDGITNAKALRTMAYLIGMLAQEAAKSPESGKTPLIPQAALTDLESKFVGVAKSFAAQGKLLTVSSLPSILYRWKDWGNIEEIKTWVASATKTNEGLVRFVGSFAQYTHSQYMGDMVGRRNLRLNPKGLEPFISIDDAAERLKAIVGAGGLAPDDMKNAEQFLREYDLLKQGKNLDSPFGLDD